MRSRIWQQLGSRGVWSLGLIAFAFTLYALNSLAFDSLRLNGFASEWIPIWVGTFLLVAVVGGLLVFAAPRAMWATPARGRFTNLVITVTLGAIKNSSVFWWAKYQGLEPTAWDPFIRIFGGATLAICIVLIWVSITGSRSAHRRILAQLAGRNAELVRARENAPAQASRLQVELVDQTKSTLLPKLALLEKTLTELNQPGDSLAVVSQLQEVLASDVKPLSAAFQRAADELAFGAPNDAAQNPRIRIRRLLPASFSLRESLAVIATLALAIPAELMMIHLVATSAEMSTVLMTAPLVVASLFLIKALLPRDLVVRRLPGLLLIAQLALLAALPQVIALTLWLPRESQSRWLIVGTAAYAVVLSFGITAYLMLIEQARLAVEAEMAEVNSSLNLQVAVFDQTLWLQRRRWGYLLHGSVQATLTVAIARLKSLEHSPIRGAERTTEAGMVAELVRQDLRRIQDAISNPPASSVDLRAELRALQETWRGVLDISINVAERAQRALDKSDNLRMALNEICREAATNAYRHGGATTMTLRIDRPVATEILLTAANNGRPPVNPHAGMGSQMMDALTLEWGFENKKTAALTVLSARLPVAI